MHDGQDDGSDALLIAPHKHKLLLLLLLLLNCLMAPPYPAQVDL